jgi:hypothetical protein
LGGDQRQESVMADVKGVKIAVLATDGAEQVEPLHQPG